jgi:hypothetical protein
MLGQVNYPNKIRVGFVEIEVDQLTGRARARAPPTVFDSARVALMISGK